MAKKLLLADDSVTIQKVVHLSFAAEDVEIESVDDGDQAIRKAASLKPDVVLADVHLPGCSGYEICRQIKSDPELSNTPVVLLVGTFESFDEEEASLVKCDAHLTKPLNTSELVRLVFSLIERNGSAKAAAVTAEEEEQLELVSSRARQSFLGTGAILDLFDSPAPQTQTSGRTAAAPKTRAATAAADNHPKPPRPQPETKSHPLTPPRQVIPFPGVRSGATEPSQQFPEEVIDQIVERVVRRMSREVVREIAWEVVPEISEIMIRQYLDGRK